MENKLIWDLPTRLFHWLLVAGLVAQYITGDVLDDAMQWHFYIGYGVLGLLIFRFVWGFAGPQYARFSNFVSSPAKVLQYAKTLGSANASAHAGHNPLGGWFVIIMLVMVATQAITGLFVSDDIFFDGPWHHVVSEDTTDLMTLLHHRGFNVLLGVIALHIGAIVFYAIVKKQRLVPAMVHGKKATSAAAIDSSRLLTALIIAIISAALVYYIVAVAPPAPVDEGFYY